MRNAEYAMAGCDIITLTSLNEGTPMSLIEAQICGKPVVAVDTGGVRDTFIPNETGFLLMNYDAGLFAEKLSILIKDVTLRECMGKKGHIFAKQKFSKKAEVDAFRELYASCIHASKK